jgi:uncharacterized membrane-anchored protein
MQDAVQRENETRVKQNFSKVELVGWAAAPRYDQQTHKLYWAKEFDFGGGPSSKKTSQPRLSNW